MDGLHTSEFALVLRDSLSSTPRRLSVCAPLSAPPPRKKPRLPAVEPHPSSAPSVPPTLPSRREHAFGPPPPTLVMPSHMRGIDNLRYPTFSNSSTDSAPAGSPTSVKSHPLSASTSPYSPHRFRAPPPMFKQQPLVQSLDVLATVSAEQHVKLPSLPNMPPLTGQQQPTSTLLQVPTTPVTPPPESHFRAVLHAPNGTRVTLPSPTSPSKAIASMSKTRRVNGKGRGIGKTTRTKSFSCQQCSSAFTERFNLNKHVRAVHERRRPFECATCHARFQQRDHMQKHEICVHKKLRQFSCSTCGASFGWRGVLKKHRKSVHHIVDP